MINIEGISKEALLLALFDNAGYIENENDKKVMNLGFAAEYLKRKNYVINGFARYKHHFIVDVSGDELDETWYEKETGVSVQSIIDDLRSNPNKYKFNPLDMFEIMDSYVRYLPENSNLCFDYGFDHIYNPYCSIYDSSRKKIVINESDILAQAYTRMLNYYPIYSNYAVLSIDDTPIFLDKNGYLYGIIRNMSNAVLIELRDHGKAASECIVLDKINFPKDFKENDFVRLSGDFLNKGEKKGCIRYLSSEDIVISKVSKDNESEILEYGDSDLLTYFSRINFLGSFLKTSESADYYEIKSLIDSLKNGEKDIALTSDEISSILDVLIEKKEILINNKISSDNEGKDLDNITYDWEYERCEKEYFDQLSEIIWYTAENKKEFDEKNINKLLNFAMVNNLGEILARLTYQFSYLNEDIKVVSDKTKSEYIYKILNYCLATKNSDLLYQIIDRGDITVGEIDEKTEKYILSSNNEEMIYYFLKNKKLDSNEIAKLAMKNNWLLVLAKLYDKDYEDKLENKENIKELIMSSDNYLARATLTLDDIAGYGGNQYLEKMIPDDLENYTQILEDYFKSGIDEEHAVINFHRSLYKLKQLVDNGQVNEILTRLQKAMISANNLRSLSNILGFEEVCHNFPILYDYIEKTYPQYFYYNLIKDYSKSFSMNEKKEDYIKKMVELSNNVIKTEDILCMQKFISAVDWIKSRNNEISQQVDVIISKVKNAITDLKAKNPENQEKFIKMVEQMQLIFKKEQDDCVSYSKALSNFNNDIENNVRSSAYLDEMENLACYSYVWGKGEYSNCKDEINSSEIIKLLETFVGEVQVTIYSSKSENVRKYYIEDAQNILRGSFDEFCQIRDKVSIEDRILFELLSTNTLKQIQKIQTGIYSINSEDLNMMINILDAFLKDDFKLYQETTGLSFRDDDISIKNPNNNPDYPGSGEGGRGSM